MNAESNIELVGLLVMLCATGMLGPVMLGATARALGRRVSGLTEFVQGGAFVNLGCFSLAMMGVMVDKAGALLGCLGLVTGAAYCYLGTEKLVGKHRIGGAGVYLMGTWSVLTMALFLMGAGSNGLLAFGASCSAVGLWLAAGMIRKMPGELVSARWCAWALRGAAAISVLGGLMVGLSKVGMGGLRLGSWEIAGLGGVVFASWQAVMAMMGILAAELVKRRIEEESTRDFLTGVFLRGEFNKRATNEVERCWREGKVVGCLMIDIDHFKTINDSLGHQTGDKVLVDLGKQIRSVVRPYDVVGRYGGEEFAIVLPGVTPDVARGIGERIREAIEQGTAGLQAALGCGYTVSMGLACMKGSSLEDLIRSADGALYMAKRSGRNRLAMSNDGIQVGRPKLEVVGGVA